MINSSAMRRPYAVPFAPRRAVPPWLAVLRPTTLLVSLAVLITSALHFGLVGWTANLVFVPVVIATITLIIYGTIILARHHMSNRWCRIAILTCLVIDVLAWTTATLVSLFRVAHLYRVFMGLNFRWDAYGAVQTLKEPVDKLVGGTMIAVVLLSFSNLLLVIADFIYTALYCWRRPWARKRAFPARDVELGTSKREKQTPTIKPLTMLETPDDRHQDGPLPVKADGLVVPVQDTPASKAT